MEQKVPHCSIFLVIVQTSLVNLPGSNLSPNSHLHWIPAARFRDCHAKESLKTCFHLLPFGPSVPSLLPDNPAKHKICASLITKKCSSTLLILIWSFAFWLCSSFHFLCYPFIDIGGCTLQQLAQHSKITTTRE